MPRPSIDRLRAICLALPEAVEKETWGDPTFRVRDRIFAMEKRGDGRISLWCKAPPGSQMVLVGADPERFFVPPYVGHKGWVGVRLDRKPDWERGGRADQAQLPPDRTETARGDDRMRRSNHLETRATDRTGARRARRCRGSTPAPAGSGPGAALLLDLEQHPMDEIAGGDRRPDKSCSHHLE